MNTFFPLFRILLLISLISVMWACGEPPEPPEPKVIRKKIVAVRPPEITPVAEVESAAEQEEDTPPVIAMDTGSAESSPEQEAEVPEEDVTAPADTAETAVSDEAGEESEAMEVEETADETLASISEIAGDPETSGELLAAYDPDERTNPFVPLFREEPEKKETEPKLTAKPGIPEPPPRRKTPLEKLDLEQLKLVGVIQSQTGDKALVEEASGKGYIITRGTYIGIHSGRVVDIKKDRIIVEEKDEDAFGNVTIRTRELKFDRPSGDEYYEM